ncbi:MAG: GNAT family N-acetyltransferase [Planctomycetota bacterium]
MLRNRKKPLRIVLPEAPEPVTIREKLALLAPRRPIEIVGPNLVRTSRLFMRPLTVDDRATVIEALRASRNELDEYMDLWKPGDSDQDVFERQLELTRLGTKTSSSWRRGAFLEDGRLAGCFNLNKIEYGLAFSAEASWWVRTDLGRQGLGTEGVAAMMDYAIEDLPGGLRLSRVEAIMHPDNAQSRRLAMRVGMTLVEHEAVSAKLNGEWVTHVVYAKTPALPRTA